jgi:hypothetical protein
MVLTKNLIPLAFFLYLSFSLSGQVEKFNISGQISDGSNGEDIAFADITVTNLENTGTNTNAYGFYSIALPAGEHRLSFQYLGYATVLKTITLSEDIKINIELREDAAMLDEIVVTAEKENKNITRNEGSVTKIDMKDVRELPALGGEPDIMKVIQLTPGIKAAGEGNAGFYVRGGGLDQNLILLDEAPVYNPSHLLGFFSVFNGDAIKGATLYKGGMSAEYGGRTSSVVDMRMKDGNNKGYDMTGGIGLIASRLTVEGPIVKDKGSFMVSGRRTYADLFLGLSNDESTSGSSLFFYDLNVKANCRIGEKDRIYLSGYFGRDKFGFRDDFGLDWGNATGTLRWNHLFSDRLFSNTTFIYSDYDYKFTIGADENRIGLQSVINDLNFKQDFSYFANDKNLLKFGVNIIQHTIEPGNLDAGENTGINSENAPESYATEGAIYLQNEQKIGTKLSLNYGLRYSFFNRTGAGNAYDLDAEGNINEVVNYEKGESMQYYGGLEPRMSANYLLNEKSSLKLGYNRNYQYLHLLTSSTSSTPTDRWIMSSNNVKPQIADQISLGYFRNFADNMFEGSVEAYYKDMQNAIEYRTGSNIFFSEEVETDLVYGYGEAYGLEFYLKKNKGRLTGWLSYTLSRTLRQFDEINKGEKFSARQDRIHDIALVLNYKLTDKVTLTGNFVYNTGDAVTFPTGRYNVDGLIVPVYTERNGYRMPDYHRLDLGLTWYKKKTEKFESSWNFSLYNAYGRENAYSISFQPSEADPTVTEAVQLSLFKWIPSATWNFKF